MQFGRDLSEETQKILGRIYKQSQHHLVRQQAQCILLSFQGWTMPQLMQLLGISRKTLYTWLTSWEDESSKRQHHHPQESDQQEVKYFGAFQS